jgi:post-segregation antitoxin (ccd killing protein)
MLPAGSWKLENANATATTNAHPHSSSSNINSTKQQQQIPPKAVFIRLSDELLQQLKSAQSSSSSSSSTSLPAFHLELGPPSPHARPAAALLKSSERESKASIPLVGL